MIRRVRRRVSRSPDPFPLRSPEEIRAQYEAARAFAGEVTRMLPTSHQYTAGQAAALAWLLDQGPPPLTFAPASALGEPVGEDPSPEAIARLSARARELMDGRNELFPPAYAMGVDYVCEWVQGRTEMLPIPRAEGPRTT
jgi:hypothetical protein